jgi:hypothetical protein
MFSAHIPNQMHSYYLTARTSAAVGGHPLLLAGYPHPFSWDSKTQTLDAGLHCPTPSLELPQASVPVYDVMFWVFRNACSRCVCVVLRPPTHSHGRLKILGERFGREVWERGLGERFGREVWERGLGERFGREVWERGLGERFGREVWERGLGERFGREVWERGFSWRTG